MPNINLNYGLRLGDSLGRSRLLRAKHGIKVRAWTKYTVLEQAVLVR